MVRDAAGFFRFQAVKGTPDRVDLDAGHPSIGPNNARAAGMPTSVVIPDVLSVPVIPLWKR